jgi:hypothetical protein
MFAISKLLRSTLPFLLVATVLTIALPSTASAAGITYPCNSGQTYTVTSGVVSSGRYCTGTFTIDSSARSIGDYAFQSGTAITSVTIPSEVTSIGAGAFYGASALISISLPDKLQSIGANAFRFTALTDFPIPRDLILIGSIALINMSDLVSFTIDPANTSFSSIGGVLFNNLQTQLIQYPPARTPTSYVVPSSVTSIGSYAFDSIRFLTSITIPSSVTSFGSWIFFRSPLTSYTYCGSASLTGTGISGTPTSCSSTPGGPTIGTATATGTTTATVSYTAPGSNGGSTILSYTATSSPGGVTATITQATSGTISITGLSPSTSYTFTITALNSVGASSASAASNSITTLPTRDSGPPPSFLIVKSSPTISLTGDIYTCNAGTLIFWRYSITEEPSKLSHQKISLLRDGTEVASSVTLKSLATFEKISTWTGSTMTCQIYDAQENTVGTFSSLGADKYNELSKIKAATTKAAEAKHSADRKAAYDNRRVELSRISDVRASELKVAKTSAQVKAAAAKYRLAMIGISQTWEAEIQAAPARRDASKAAAAAAFIQGLAQQGLSIVQP